MDVNVTPLARLEELSKLMKANGISRAKLMFEGIELEMSPKGFAVIEEAVIPGLKEDPLSDEDVLFHSAGGISDDMPGVPAGMLEMDQ